MSSFGRSRRRECPARAALPLVLDWRNSAFGAPVDASRSGAAEGGDDREMNHVARRGSVVA